MGQIPIQRGSGDSGALDRAIEELRKGACIGIYPKGTRSLGRALRARSGVGYLARAVPEATIIGVACDGTVAIPRFPRSRPHVRVEFFAFDRPAIAPMSHRSSTAPGCSPSFVSARLSRSRAASAPQHSAAASPLVPGTRDHRQARRQGRARGGARPDRPQARLAFPTSVMGLSQRSGGSLLENSGHRFGRDLPVQGHDLLGDPRTR